MAVCLVTGAGGLIGSCTARFMAEQGFDVVGVDNDMRSYFFGNESSTKWNITSLSSSLTRYTHCENDIRDQAAMERLFVHYGKNIQAIVHAAAQPSHDWAAREPLTDFSINASATVLLLELTRKHCPEAPFIFTSTNKVYGDTPNSLPLRETDTRFTVEPSHPYSQHGIDESMSIDVSTHSVFGASKVAADVMVQEYGRYFDMNTVCFRGGCLTGADHSGAQLHGFLSYLIKCGVNRTPYTVFGYKGKQVRDNIHAQDLITMFWEYIQNPRPGEVYNAGGGVHSNCSVLEAITLFEEVMGIPFNFSYQDQNRVGDHLWWISDVRKFRQHYPNWSYTYDLRAIFTEMATIIKERGKN
ncbi:NAD-dependent epimerase/dehydratase family protein [Desulfovibrio inopinatus]|uniref:NAD-dependent epimerase/dehydratase family protein n=1 Tax=Desulfovibrio inopinatus TaxID=102109 RepID=UPI00041B8188|nr:NAD-dependent epimerase/dehydratase family protein [Desulfovibrio inopinatus]